ncbi:class I SAM-dependent methyltransferase [Geitlerinema sp. PCC 9228]|jgi:SAM-dependent methyltransferase|uniref:class I SAM-dependent methyltransferase n=1 Tax=Geitlerinema sp. PCC 9228 TaxID=111611 RepID=UPI0008F9D61A|nr:class I SAM-dependent methyltransferase [Geitlerinema sp. PCC 9228]
MSNESRVKTEEKKQHFDDIYMESTPVPFKERIIDALDYISDNNNRETFDRLILPWCEQQQGRKIPYLDLACCFGNTTLAIAHNMTVDEIRQNWQDTESAKQPLKSRRLNLQTTGIDISENALNYARNAGIFDRTIQADLNQPSPEKKEEVLQAMGEADILVSTAALVYLEASAIDELISTFAGAPREGYCLVNFLNPFGLEKADATKRILLKHLDFVGSTATRHRLLSDLERENYPGEEWSLLEIWVLKRNG